METTSDHLAVEVRAAHGTGDDDGPTQRHPGSGGLGRFLLQAESVGSSAIEGLRVGSRRLLAAEEEIARGLPGADSVTAEVLGNIGEQYSRRGYATEALGPLTYCLFSTKLMNRLQLSIRRDNLASRRVAEKGGYTQEGVMRSVAFIDGRFHDIELWSITRQMHEAL